MPKKDVKYELVERKREGQEVKELELNKLTFEDESEANVKLADVNLQRDDATELIKGGRKLLNLKTGKVYEFAGYIDDPSVPDKNGKFACKLAGTEIHAAFDGEELDRNILVYEGKELIREINDELKKEVELFWKSKCENNKENNPDDLPAPKF